MIFLRLLLPTIESITTSVVDLGISNVLLSLINTFIIIVFIVCSQSKDSHVDDSNSGWLEILPSVASGFSTTLAARLNIVSLLLSILHFLVTDLALMVFINILFTVLSMCIS